ncbi:MAG TPA: OstA-like protein [Lentimicrobium sp.]|jgi:lipopolysaccharide export system protein LptA|nr:OstA-like protein [Lentimicrobium sp.]
MNRLMLLFFLILPFVLPAQQTRKIRLVQADIMAYNKALGEGVQRILGNAVFEHEGAYLYCDSAHLNNATNSIKAYSRVHIKASDTLNLYGDSIYYSGETRIAEVFDNVKLIDNQTTLTTDKLIFDRNTSIAYYLTGGHIVNGRNTLDSRRGYYHTNTKDFFFREDVLLINPDYVMDCDTLHYNTQDKIARFRGPTTIKGEETDIYAENGWYNTETDISEFNENAWVRNGDQTLTGDSLYYERTNGYGEAFGNIVVTDTVQNILAYGQYALYRKALGYTMITQKPEALFINGNDTLFMHADTLKATFDSAQKTKEVYAYYRMKFYRTDMQGMSDSLIYKFSDSTLRMLGNPVLWTDENQLTADSMHILTGKEQIKQLFLYNSAFIISRDTLGAGFNQIKGREMTGYFTDNELVRIAVKGNAETLYWFREEDGSLVGIDKSFSSNMNIRLKNKKIKQIVYIEKPTAVLHPEAELNQTELVLKDFRWLESRRPVRREDIFTW